MLKRPLDSVIAKAPACGPSVISTRASDRPWRTVSTTVPDNAAGGGGEGGGGGGGGGEAEVGPGGKGVGICDSLQAPSTAMNMKAAEARTKTAVRCIAPPWP